MFYLTNISHLMNPRAAVVWLPNHLHFQAGARDFHFFVMEHMGDAGFTDMVWNVRLRSLVAASAGIAIAVQYLASVTGRLGFGVLGGILIGACHGYLLYATKVDTPIFPALGMLAVLYVYHLLSRAKRLALPLSIVLGFVLFVSVTFHQYMAFVCITAIACIALPPFLFPNGPRPSPILLLKETPLPAIDRSPRTRAIAFLLATLTGAGLVVCAFFFAGKTELNLPFDEPNPRLARFPFKEYTFQKWLFLYSSYDRWGKGLRSFTIRAPLRGFTNAFVAPRENEWRRIAALTLPYDLRKPLAASVLPYNAVAWFTLLVALGLVFLFPALWRRYGRDIAFILLTLAALSVFFAYWEPRHVEFWLVPCILACVLFIMILGVACEKLACVAGRAACIPFYALVFCFSAILFFHNLGNYVAPFTRENRLEEIDKTWEEEYYMKYFSASIYKNPEDPYGHLYKTRKSESVPDAHVRMDALYDTSASARSPVPEPNPAAPEEPREAHENLYSMTEDSNE